MTGNPPGIIPVEPCRNTHGMFVDKTLHFFVLETMFLFGPNQVLVDQILLTFCWTSKINLPLLPFLLIRKKSPKRISISSPGECSTFSHTATAAPGDRSHAAAPRHLPNPSPPVRGYWCAATRHDAETRQAAPLRRSVTPWLVLRQGCFQCIQQIWVSWDPHSKMEKHGNNIKQWCFLNGLPNTNKFYKCCKGTNTPGTNI